MTTLTIDQRSVLINKLARQVTLKDGLMYPELETALGALVDALGAGEAPPKAVDWAAVICEGTNLRPQH